jgi:hypothetical protein
MNHAFSLARGAVGGGGALRVLGAASPGRVTTTRAGLALTLDAAGAYVAAGADAPRFTGAARRLLVEGSRSNACAGSDGIARTASWSVVNISATASPAPDGTMTASLLNEGTASSQHNTSAVAMSFLDGRTYTSSVFARAGTAGAIQVFWLNAIGGACASFDLTTGTALGRTGGALARMEAVGDGWWRCQMTATATASASSPAMYLAMIASAADNRAPSYAGAGRTLAVWGAQTEEGAFASSYIPAAGAAASREADLPVWTPAGGFGAQGTLVVRALLPQMAPFGASQGLWQIDDGTDQNRILLRNTSAGSAITGVVDVAGTTVATLSAGDMTAGTPFRAAFAWAPGDQALCLSGGAVQTAAASLPAGLARMLVGHASTQLNRAAHGEVDLVEYRPARLPNAMLQALANPA